MKNFTRQSGMSLIEIMVVMVVLLVGIMTIIRIFPSGFNINRQTEMSTRAAALVNQEMERFVGSSANLMDAIVPLKPVISGNGYQFAIDTTQGPDSLSEANPKNYTSPWDYYFSNANRIRRVLGERVRIPTPSLINGKQGSYYVLSSGPFMDVSWDGQNRSIFISGAPMRRREADSNAPNPPNTGWNGYAIDYGNGLIAFAPTKDYDRQFLVTYTYYDANGMTQTLVDVPIFVAKQTPVKDEPIFPIWQPINPGSPEKLPIPSGELVSRMFIEVDPAAAWTSDPYTFYIQSSRISDIDPKNMLGANIGVIVFNPAGHNSKEYPITGSENLTARIDYDVLDWHIIHDDRPMPANAPYSVSLSLMDVKQNAHKFDSNTPDIDNDQSIYQGVFYGIQPADVNQNPDIIICNAVTGEIVPRFNGDGSQNYDVGYRSGTVTFNPVFGAGHQSLSFRFYYKARGDWALQMQKACSTYRERGDANLGYNEYLLDSYIDVNDNSKNYTYMWFAPSESNKTIQIRDVWLKYQSGAFRHLSNITLRIYPPIAGAQGRFGIYAHADIKDVDKGDDPPVPAWDWSQTGMAAKAVTGLSFKTRVIWNNGAIVNQIPNVPVLYRWRKIDLDTMLTRTLQ